MDLKIFGLPFPSMQVENVIDVLKGRASITTNALEGLKVVEIIERIYAAEALNK